MKYVLYGAVGLGVLYLVAPDTFGLIAQKLGITLPGASTKVTDTGAPAPTSNPSAPSVIGALNITGSRFGTSTFGRQNTVV